MFVNYLSLGSIIFYGYMEPNRKQKKRMEFTNTYLISVLTILLFNFTDFSFNFESEVIAGYIFLGILGIIFISNMANVTITSVRNYKFDKRRKYLIRIKEHLILQQKARFNNFIKAREAQIEFRR